MEGITYLDLFAGAGGFARGFAQAGLNIKTHYFSEIDKHAIAVYKHNFKNAKYAGNVTTISKRTIKERPNLITFGFPCQDLSIAGKREGINGKRSGLFFEAIRLIKEFKPEVFIFENVKGLLSSNQGKGFETVLRTIANLGLYECEWQLLNTAWLLPQNRERVYFVGHLRGKSTPQIFPFTKNDKVFNQTHQTKKRQTQAEISTCLKSSGAIKADDTFIVSKNAKCLTGGGNSGGLHSDMTIIPVITPDRKEKRQNGRRFKENGEPAFTLNTQDQHGILINNDAADAEHQDPQIRRLTEIEWERLQGFPDNWTKYGNYDGEVKEVSKTQRYKQMGNAVTTNWPELIAKRLTIFAPAK